MEPSHKPTVIIANTIKGYGVSFMRNDILWHYRFPHDGWEYDCAVNELHQSKPEGVDDPYTPDGIENRCCQLIRMISIMTILFLIPGTRHIQSKCVV